VRAHGTHACYVWGPASGAGDGCRCLPCRTAHSAYERERSRWVAPPFVGADRARQHVRELTAAGVGLKTISKRAGISHGALSKLMYGENGRPPSKRIRRETEDKLLAVSPSATADGAKVPAAPTLAIVGELVSRGWSKVAIARAIGQTGPGLQLGREFVTARNARAIKALLAAPIVKKAHRWSEPGVEQLEPVERPRDPYDLPSFEVEGDTGWMRRGACRRPDVPTWMFFPGRGDYRTVAAARAVCSTCPVVDECLQYALDHNQPGVWGGTSEMQRKRVRAA
jgi:hypothetical protein